jgi:uncharacterized membrane protein YfcA
VVAAQVIAPYVDGRLLAALFGFLCLIFAVRFAFPQRFRPLVDQAPGGHFRDVAALGIGAVSGFAGVGGGILTNIVMTLSGLPMHKSIGRAAAAGVIVSIPATIVAALASKALQPTQIGSIDYAIWACIAPAQAIAAWFGAGLATRISAERLSRIFAIALAISGFAIVHSALR